MKLDKYNHNIPNGILIYISELYESLEVNFLYSIIYN